jgi:hypothetical protein
MNVFRHGDEYVFALTYGAEVQWVKNILAAGKCGLKTRGRTLRLVEPVLFVDPERRPMPFPVRQLLGLMRVSEFLRMRVATSDRAGSAFGENRPAAGDVKGSVIQRKDPPSTR